MIKTKGSLYNCGEVTKKKKREGFEEGKTNTQKGEKRRTLEIEEPHKEGKRWRHFGL